MDAGLVLTGLGLTGLAGKVAYDIAGPFCKELGERLKDELSPYRAVRQKQLLEKTARMLKAAELKGNPVPPKLLVKIFDEAGLEDDEGLHTMWAALLANAATAPDSTSPALIDILSQLSQIDALFLQELLLIAEKNREESEARQKHFLKAKIGERYKEFQPPPTRIPSVNLGPISGAREYFANALRKENRLATEELFGTTLDNLIRLRVIESVSSPPALHGEEIQEYEPSYYFTHLGALFMKNCQPPKPASPPK